MGKDITKLHPELQVIAKLFLVRCNAAGLNVLITETFRTKSEQVALYARGRTAPGNIVTNANYPYSPHCWGVAFDFCRNEKGREYNDSDGFFKKCGQIGKTLGLNWGGDWVGFVDKPHLEMTKFMPNSSSTMLIKKYGVPENFIKTWDLKGVITGMEVKKELTVDEAIKLIQDKTGLEDKTMEFLQAYKYSDVLIGKLAAAMNK